MGAEITVPVEVEVPPELYEQAKLAARENDNALESELFDRTVFKVNWQTP